MSFVGFFSLERLTYCGGSYNSTGSGMKLINSTASGNTADSGRDVRNSGTPSIDAATVIGDLVNFGSVKKI